MILYSLWTINTNYLTQFLRFRNPGLASLGASGSGGPVRLQSRCWPGLQSFEGLTGAGDPLPRRLTYVAETQFLSDCYQGTPVSHQLGFSMELFKMWHLLFPWASDLREHGRSHDVFHDWVSEVACHGSCHLLLITWINHGTCGRRQGCE